MNWNHYDLIVFDLDNTLAMSKLSIDSKMSKLFTKLLDIRKIAVISGGGFGQIKKELLDMLPENSNFQNLHLFPTDGGAYYRWNGKWEPVYINSLSDDAKSKIKEAVFETLEETALKTENPMGELLEDRGSAMVFSGLGQEALLENKQKWDPDESKRFLIKKILDEKLPDFEVSVAGTTSIDITRKGIDKAYGIRKMVEYINVPLEKIVFIGDALFPGGNDNAVIETGIKIVSVRDPEDTKKIIKEII
ncbi:MAG TPA: HAD-IIB family hydrolase [Candidatus Paceibacterota bacterium]